MVRLRLKNPVPDTISHHAPFPFPGSNHPLKPRVEGPTNRRFEIVSLPQEDGKFVASVVQAPSILVYDKSRKSAEERATKAFLKTPDADAYKAHPLATTKAVMIDMDYDEESRRFVTYVKELHGMSTFGETEWDALNNTAEMIRGYIKSMQANRKRIPLSPRKLAELKVAVEAP